MEPSRPKNLGKEFEEIFKETMIEETKLAIAMNTFVNFITKIFGSYIEKYPLIQFRHVLTKESIHLENLTKIMVNLLKITITKHHPKTHHHLFCLFVLGW